MRPLTFAITYAVLATATIPLIFALFKTKYRFLDVLMASVGAAVVYFLVPSPIGGPASLIVHVGLLYWRIRENLVPDIVAAVAAARLGMIPIMLSLNYHGLH